MSWYYDDDSVSNYYTWWKQSKELEKMRKRKAKLQEKREAKLERERQRIKNRQERLELKQRQIEERKNKKKETLEELKKVGYKPTWTKQNPLKRAKNSRDLNLCREIYEKSKSGVSIYNLAKEYDMHPNTVIRHKFEYEYYLGIKSIDKEIEL